MLAKPGGTKKGVTSNKPSEGHRLVPEATVSQVMLELVVVVRSQQRLLLPVLVLVLMTDSSISDSDGVVVHVPVGAVVKLV